MNSGKDRGQETSPTSLRQEASPTVTIVMSARERHGMTLRAIHSVLERTAPGFRFIYLDVQSPPALRAELAKLAARGQLELRQYDEPLWPQAARRDVVPDI